MFTSRSEFRLSLRADNADDRLTPTGIAIGAVSAARVACFAALQHDLGAWRRRLDSLDATPAELGFCGVIVNQDGQRRSAFQLLSRPDVTLSDLARVWPELGSVPQYLVERLETDATYSVYLERQARDLASFRRDEAFALPDRLDARVTEGLSAEIRAKLDLVQPATLGQAARIEGMTPAALTLLAAAARRAPSRVADKTG